MLIGALKRRVEAAGGFAMVLHSGDPVSGVILLQLCERGVHVRLVERITDLDGQPSLLSCGPETPDHPAEIRDYMDRRRRSDPDLWLIELDVAQAQALAADVLCAG